MRSARGIPIALANSDVPDSHHMLVHSCEDCACPVSRSEAKRTTPSTLPLGSLTRARDVLELSL
ncbi:MAG: hypothetical protein LC808_13085, partial [Actinobacteria bacterium]|nr:hypothetical protein [Actinomycetota bacterium]